MKTSKPINVDNFVQQKFKFWLSRIVILAGIGMLAYYGYCFGLWGRSSLLLQYLFQCKCPFVSEERRYPKEVDVIVSACHEGWVELSPSGCLLSVREKNSEPYILNLQTNEKIMLSLPQESGFDFLTDTLLFVSFSYEENHILDRATNTMYPILRFMHVYPGSFINGDADLTILANALGQAKYVFFRASDGTIIALDPDFPASFEESFITGWFDMPVKVSSQVEQFLIANDIAYKTILPDLSDGTVSPDGKFLARNDGIYLVDNNQKIVEGVSFSVRGWTYDGRGVVYSSGDRCLIPLLIPFADDTGCYVDVDQPILLLKVPEKYLPPTPTP